MNIRKLSFVLSTLVFLFPTTNLLAANEKCGQFLDQIIIKFKTVSSLEHPKLSADWWDILSKKSGLPIQSVKPMANGAYLAVIDSKKLAQLPEIKNVSKNTYFKQGISKLLKQSDILYADRDMTYCPIKPPVHPKKTSFSSTNIPLISHASQWDEFSYPGVFLESAPGLLDGAWSITLGYANPPIVISNFEGINYNPDLAPNVLTGWNFANDSTDTTDPTGDHGTHTAGTIAATGAVLGIAGMGPLLKILPIEVATLSQLEQGIYWSIGKDISNVPHNNTPIKVGSMSFAFNQYFGCPPSLQEAIDTFVANGSILVVSAGNDNIPATNNPPRSCNNVMVVAATQINGYRASYSNYGPHITLAAPGGEQSIGDVCDANGILSTVSAGSGCQNSGFSFFEGTSMATPHVAGIAGLIYALNPYTSSQEVKSILLESVAPFGNTTDPTRSCTGTISCGVGIVNANNAVRLAISGREIVAAPSPTDLDLKTSFDPFNRCPPNLYVPAAKLIPSPLTNNWTINKSTHACQPLNVYENPVLQVNGQQVIATFGKTVVTLQTPGLSCQVNYPHGFIC